MKLLSFYILIYHPHNVTPSLIILGFNFLSVTKFCSKKYFTGYIELNNSRKIRPIPVTSGLTFGEIFLGK